MRNFSLLTEIFWLNVKYSGEKFDSLQSVSAFFVGFCLTVSISSRSLNPQTRYQRGGVGGESVGEFFCKIFHDFSISHDFMGLWIDPNCESTWNYVSKRNILVIHPFPSKNSRGILGDLLSKWRESEWLKKFNCKFSIFLRTLFESFCVLTFWAGNSAKID